VSGQLDAIRASQAAGGYIVAIKDAHDWLIANGIIPKAAVAIDPQASRATVFQHPHESVHYLIASQVHPTMLDQLAGYRVSLWHAYVRKNQSVPPHGTPLISGGTTTGLRAITLLYSMGFRDFELYGYDSCLSNGVLRMNGTVPRPGDDTINDIVVGWRTFACNPSMTAQASEFQNLFWSMPDLTIRSYGDGLITAILQERQARPLRTVSFLHSFGPRAASYRYRAESPAKHLGATLNNRQADVWVVAKPESVSVPEVKAALGEGKSVIVDFCDDHFHTPHYRDMLRLADAVTCSTAVLAKTIAALGREATVIDDPFEYPEAAPHCRGNRLLWFGHGLNRPTTFPFPVRMVSNSPGDIPWSYETMLDEFATADIVLLPRSAAYKSANRAVEAIRQGCFVVAEDHPALREIPGLWIGSLEEGIAWAQAHPAAANERIRHSQTYISERFDPRTVAAAWSRVIQVCPSTWGQGTVAGLAGSMSISREPMSVAT
jgi:hypothetical protein